MSLPVIPFERTNLACVQCRDGMADNAGPGMLCPTLCGDTRGKQSPCCSVCAPLERLEPLSVSSCPCACHRLEGGPSC